MLATLMERLNDRRAAEFDGDEAADAGFTLIELMVVLLILAILLAIAIPTFLSVTGSANDRAVQSNLNTALTDGKSIYENNSQLYPVTASFLTQLGSNEPSLTSSLVAVPAGPTAASATSIGQGKIEVYVNEGDNKTPVGNVGEGVVIMGLAQKTNHCLAIVDNTTQIDQGVANLGTADALVYGTDTPLAAAANSPATTKLPTMPGEYYIGWNDSSVTGAANVPCDITDLVAAAGKPSYAIATGGWPTITP